MKLTPSSFDVSCLIVLVVLYRRLEETLYLLAFQKLHGGCACCAALGAAGELILLDFKYKFKFGGHKAFSRLMSCIGNLSW